MPAGNVDASPLSLDEALSDEIIEAPSREALCLQVEWTNDTHSPDRS